MTHQKERVQGREGEILIGRFRNRAGGMVRVEADYQNPRCGWNLQWRG